MKSSRTPPLTPSYMHVPSVQALIAACTDSPDLRHQLGGPFLTLAPASSRSKVGLKIKARSACVDKVVRTTTETAASPGFSVVRGKQSVVVEVVLGLAWKWLAWRVEWEGLRSVESG